MPVSEPPSTSISQALPKLDPMLYFKRKRLPEPFPFSGVEKWVGFEEVLAKSMGRMGDLYYPSRFMTTSEIDLLRVNPLLHQRGLSLRFVEGKSLACDFIGVADLVLCDTSNVVLAPLLAGHHYSELSLDCEFSKLAGKLLDPEEITRLDASGTSTPPAAEARRALRALSHQMLINDLAYGYISSETTTLFVNIALSGSEVRLRISKPYNSHDIYKAMLALSLEVYHGHPYLRYFNGFEIVPEAVENPSVLPLSRFEQGVAGRVNWWVASNLDRQRLTLIIDHRAVNEGHATCSNTLMPQGEEYAWKTGVIIVDGSQAISTNLKVSSTESSLRHEASVWQFLLDKGAEVVPRLIAYAHLLENDFHVLVSEPFGRKIVQSDLESAEVRAGMQSALASLHGFGIMLGKISLECFRIDLGPNGPVVRIIDFRNSKLYRRIPQAARVQELGQLQALICR